MSMVVLVVGKWIKVFKKRNEVELGEDQMGDGPREDE